MEEWCGKVDPAVCCCCCWTDGWLKVGLARWYGTLDMSTCCC